MANKTRHPSVWLGLGRRRTNFLSSSSFSSNLLHKSRDIGKRVSRFLCNEFAVRGEGGKEGSKSRGGARLISPFTSGVFAELDRVPMSFSPCLDSSEIVFKLTSNIADQIHQGWVSHSREVSNKSLSYPTFMAN